MPVDKNDGHGGDESVENRPKVRSIFNVYGWEGRQYPRLTVSVCEPSLINHHGSVGFKMYADYKFDSGSSWNECSVPMELAHDALALLDQFANRWTHDVESRSFNLPVEIKDAHGNEIKRVIRCNVETGLVVYHDEEFANPIYKCFPAPMTVTKVRGK
jgi:hypothetical protein